MRRAKDLSMKFARALVLVCAAALGLMPALEASAAGLMRGAPRLKFGKRGGTYGAPRFPSGAKLAVTRTEKGLSLVIPAAEPEARARAYVFEVEVRGAEGAKPYAKTVMAAGYNESERLAAAKAETRFDIPSADLPTGDLKVSVTPVNCFGKKGYPLTFSQVQ